MAELKVPAQWEPDCQGKWDFDGRLVSLSTRYWPRGGGFHALSSAGWEGNEARPEIKPSAKATIYLGSTQDEFYSDAVVLAEQSFDGATEAEVKQAVEVWATAQYERIAAGLRGAYGVAIPRKPLTDEQIEQIAQATFRRVQDMPDDKVNGSTWDREFARAIEAHVSGVTEADRD